MPGDAVLFPWYPAVNGNLPWADICRSRQSLQHIGLYRTYILEPYHRVNVQPPRVPERNDN